MILMPINAGYEYLEAEKVYLRAQTLEEKILALEEMIRTCPAHKGAENLRAELRRRLKKFKEKQETAKKTGKTSKKSIKKEGFQFVLIGKTNSGKSMLLGRITNAKSNVGDYPFTTKEPVIGTFAFGGVKAQVIDMPSLGGGGFDVGITNTADCLLIIVEKLEDINDIEKELNRARGKRIIVINKIDLLDDRERRKLEDRIKSKRINGIAISALNGEGIDKLKEKIFLEMGVIRVYTKEPGKTASKDPVVLKDGAIVKDVAENIRKGFYLTIRETRLTGPSGKFPNQRVGLNHLLKDRDIVEFHVK